MSEKPTFPEPPPPLPPTPLAQIDLKLANLDAHKADWPKVTLAERIRLLDELAKGIVRVAEAWCDAGARRKGLDPASEEAGEEWLAGPVVTLRNLRLLREALEAGGAPKPSRVHDERGPDGVGRKVARVFPASLLDRLTFGGVTVDVVMAPGQPVSQGRVYREDKGEGRVCLVLGGGNVSSIAPMDALYKLFVEDEVVLLKTNPVCEHVGPLLEDAFAPLVDRGYFAIVYGGAHEGAYAAAHALTGSLHVTGSDATYDAIVWGASEEERTKNRAEGTPKNTRPFTAELGCVTPVLVVPGPWSEADLVYQARHVASMVTQNASFNCNAAKVLVMARGWLQREAFLEHLHAELAKVPRRKAYYPGAERRHRSFFEAYPNATPLGPSDVAPETLPWTVIPDVPARAGEHALTHEAFCGVLAEVTLDLADETAGFSRDPYPDAERFLAKAVPFVNERVWGTLSCILLAHPTTLDAHGGAIERAITELRYGAVAVNCWAGLVYGLVVPPWGAYPGHTREAITSGTGFVHNTSLFDHPEKTVVRAPFRTFPKLPYFSDHKAMKSLAKALMAVEARPGLGELWDLVKASLRG